MKLLVGAAVFVWIAVAYMLLHWYEDRRNPWMMWVYAALVTMMTALLFAYEGWFTAVLVVAVWGFALPVVMLKPRLTQRLAAVSRSNAKRKGTGR